MKLRKLNQDTLIKGILLTLFGVMFFIYYSGNTSAAPNINYQSRDLVTTAFDAFARDVRFNAIDLQIAKPAERIMLFATVLLLLVAIGRWALNEINIVEVASTVILIIAVSIINHYYTVFMWYFLHWSTEAQRIIALYVIGTADTQILSEFMATFADKVKSDPLSITGSSVQEILSYVILRALLSLLGFASYFVNNWFMWGYSLCLVTAWIFIPFLLFKRFVFLFDGWLKLFLYFLVYGIIGKVSLCLLVKVFSLYLQTGVAQLASIPVMKVSALSNGSGLAMLMFVGVVALFMTGAFTQMIVGGGGLNFGSALSTATRTLTAKFFR